MTFQSSAADLSPRERRDYGFARVRDIAFDAIQTLWRRRHGEGMKQTDIVRAIGRQPAWVSRNLRAPGNWTLRTIGELAEALGGEVEIIVHAMEDPPAPRRNFTAYDEYEGTGGARGSPDDAEHGGQVLGKPVPEGREGAGQVIGR
jgi:hypothetical protein